MSTFTPDQLSLLVEISVYYPRSQLTSPPLYTEQRTLPIPFSDNFVSDLTKLSRYYQENFWFFLANELVFRKYQMRDEIIEKVVAQHPELDWEREIEPTVYLKVLKAPRFTPRPSFKPFL